MVDRFAAESPDPEGFRGRVQKFRALDREARLTGAVEKEGFDTGRRALNPFTGEHVPIWIANFVLAEYGNTASAGSLIAFALHNDDLPAGSIGVMAAFGAGYSLGSLLLQRQ